MYITWITDFFKQTNRRKDYKRQILDYNIEKLILIRRNNIDIFSFIKVLMQTYKNAILQINSMTYVKKIRKELKWHIQRNK